MSLTIGIIGLPQAGKTTLFHTLTRFDESAAGGGGGSQKPHAAHVQIPDSRLDRLSAIFLPKKHTPASIDFLDVAATGAETEEKGALGKRVLGAFRTVDTLVEVVRCFNHPYLGEARPMVDLENLELELLISDLSVIQNTLHRNKKMPADAYAWFEELGRILEEGQRPHPDVMDRMPENARIFVQSMSLLVAKPCIVCANIPDDLLGKEDSDPRVAAARQYAQDHHRQFFTVCGAIEQEIAQLAPEEAQSFMEGMGIQESGLNKLIQAAYRSLNLMTFFTVGEDECRAWTARVGASAPEAAGKIHTDLEKGFIRAEVCTTEDLLELKTTAACRDKGLLRLEGKTYVVQDGDVLNIRFNI